MLRLKILAISHIPFYEGYLIITPSLRVNPRLCTWGFSIKYQNNDKPQLLVILHQTLSIFLMPNKPRCIEKKIALLMAVPLFLLIIFVDNVKNTTSSATT